MKPMHSWDDRIKVNLREVKCESGNLIELFHKHV
jgi:hypothetical protein